MHERRRAPPSRHPTTKANTLHLWRRSDKCRPTRPDLLPNRCLCDTLSSSCAAREYSAGLPKCTLGEITSLKPSHVAAASRLSVHNSLLAENPSKESSFRRRKWSKLGHIESKSTLPKSEANARETTPKEMLGDLSAVMAQ